MENEPLNELMKNCQLLLDLYTYTYVVYQLMYENVYGKTPPPRFGENAVTFPLDVDRPCFLKALNQCIAVNLKGTPSIYLVRQFGGYQKQRRYEFPFRAFFSSCRITNQ